MKNWTYREGSTPHFQGLVYCEETGEDIAVTYHDESGEKARLIAAAPEMLELLNKVQKSLTKWDESDSWDFKDMEILKEVNTFLDHLQP